MAKEVRRQIRKKPPVPKQCFFCSEQKLPWYSDTSTLQRFVTDRGKIVARSRSGICAKHQRRLGDAIKHARHLALIPYISRD
jgi:small subunit ribosomal protein S18